MHLADHQSQTRAQMIREGIVLKADSSPDRADDRKQGASIAAAIDRPAGTNTILGGSSLEGLITSEHAGTVGQGWSALSGWERTQPLASDESDHAGRQAWPQIPGFEILARCGRGGMGEVYRAYDLGLRIEVAIKVPRSLTPESRRLFLEEARKLAQVQHRNVVVIRSCGETDAHAYFTMDLARGATLAELVPVFREAGAQTSGGPEILLLAGIDHKNLSSELRACCRARKPYYQLVANWIAEAADGLAAAHARRILHRDIKPGNLLLSSEGRVLVVDFGLAVRPEEFEQLQYQGATGTLPYIPPERVMGDWSRVDHRADLWSLGASLYELLAFQRAYAGHGTEVLKEIAMRDAAPPGSIVPTIPRGLERICMRALARDPNQRFQSADELAAALRRWIRKQRTGFFRSFATIATSLAAVVALQLFWVGNVHQEQAPPKSLGENQALTPATRVHASSEASPTGGSERPVSATQPATAPSLAVITPTSAPAEPIPPAAAPPTPRPCVLLALNEDLDGRFESPPEASANVERLVSAELQKAGLEICFAQPLDGAWTLRDVVQTARKTGMQTVLYGTLTATPVSSVSVSFQSEPVVTWRMQLHLTLVRVGDRVERHVSSRPRDVQPAAAGDAYPGRVQEIEYLVRETLVGNSADQSVVGTLRGWLPDSVSPRNPSNSTKSHRSARAR